jgi:3-deoxy-D-manno-octulosonate 8-phosphate phosphatase (KDO 8-P phosphatase)
MSRIRILVLDVDGVLTDGSIYISDQGDEMKAFNSRDGHGIKLLQRAGIETAIITGRISKALEHRTEELGIRHVVQNAKDKRDAILKLSSELGIDTGEMAYMGDDVVDLPAMALCSMTFAPSDAMDIVKEKAQYVTKLPGGKGAVREAIEVILKNEGLYDEVMKRYAV